MVDLVRGTKAGQQAWYSHGNESSRASSDGRRIALPILLTLIAGLSLLAPTALQCRRKAAAAGIGLVVPQDALHLGTVWMQKDYHLELPLKNITEHPIELFHLKSSCACTSTAEAIVVPPYGTRTAALHINLMSLMPEEPEDAEWVFSLPLVPVVNSDSHRVPCWTIRGRARRLFANAPRQINFGESCVYGEEYPLRQVELRATHPLERVRVECDTAPSACRVRWRLETPTVVSLSVEPRRDLPVGRFDSSLQVFVTIGEADEFCAAEIPVFGTVVGDVAASPSILLLGAVEEQQPIEQTIWLRSRSGKVWHVKARKNDGIKIEPCETQVCDERALGLRIVPQRGVQNLTISFLVQRGSRKWVLEIPLKYVGIDRER